MTAENPKIEDGQTYLTGANKKAEIRVISIFDLAPSPENDKIYRPVLPDDPAIVELADDIRKNGLLEPIICTRDLYIISGHRRYVAADLAGMRDVPCKILDIVRSDPEFIKLLVSYNSQRVKNHSEAMREILVKTNPDEAYSALIEHREKSAVLEAETIQVGQRGCRKAITEVKSKMVAAVKSIIHENRKFWPLSDRQIHYRFLNAPPLRNTENPKSRYKNNRASYQDVCDLLTRLRLNGEISMSSIADPTRPTTSWAVYDTPQSFAGDELDDFLKGYRRNLQQSQPLHIEIIGEKMTIESIIRPVCGQYNIPYTIGRGYSSLPARYEIVKRFRRSGKERMLLLILADHDPEGIDIGESLLKSLREDFGEYNTEAIRVGINLEHVGRFKLADNTGEAKKTSSRYRKFARRFGTNVFELEALTPVQLQTILREAIDQVIDVGAFNAELNAEKKDAAFLQAVREQLCEGAFDILGDLQNFDETSDHEK